MNRKGISSIATILIIIGVLIIVGGVWYWQNQKEKPVVCTQDVKLCPDSSYVSRTGPNCEFTACPQVQDPTASWQTYKNSTYEYEMKYPKNWTAEHSSGYNEALGLNYESNIFKDMSGKYILFFGLVPKGSDIRTPNLRTGVGGTPVKKDETINIDGTNFGVTEIVTNGKVTEFWVESIKINNLKGRAEFMYLSNNPLENVDISNVPELAIAKQILSTLKFTK